MSNAARCAECGAEMVSLAAGAICPADPGHRGELECIDDHNGGCSGGIEYRPSLTGTGTAIPRCDKHWTDRLNKHERDRHEYPDSPIAPSWFDPSAAGERWDDDY
jgi:hypothetical protein